MYRSYIKEELARKYAWKHFLSITERTKEFLSVLFMFVAGMALIAYFYSHFIVWIITNHYAK